MNPLKMIVDNVPKLVQCLGGTDRLIEATRAAIEAAWEEQVRAAWEVFEAEKKAANGREGD